MAAFEISESVADGVSVVTFLPGSLSATGTAGTSPIGIGAAPSVHEMTNNA